mmetsp:Transcript_41006/g.101575  ORF Transcript_41006/g.101575 Transcript_41006/m.101575 type:complete len:358 (+) Transcript_41006:443-1516(+)
MRIPAACVEGAAAGSELAGSAAGAASGARATAPAVAAEAPVPAPVSTVPAATAVAGLAVGSGSAASPAGPGVTLESGATVGASASGDGEEMGVYDGEEQFMLVDDLPNGHYYAASPPLLSRGFTQAVQKEWKMLQRSLPAGIYVVACSSRMDLLRVMLFGPTGTPYADSPFVFDISLPADYPQTSPQLHYDSRTERIHPNLYENGKVCLSILGTWAGKGVEVWDPASSNLLRVLISLQGLVLVPQPYFNEAGYERQMGTAEGLHNSRLYNEGAFLLSQKLHVLLLRNMPQPFESLCHAHYRATARRIIARCKVVLDERKPPEGTPTDASHALCSEGLVHSLRKLMPHVEQAMKPYLE